MIDWNATAAAYQVYPTTIKTAQLVIVVCERCAQPRSLAYRKAKYQQTHHCKACASQLAMANPATKSKLSESLKLTHQDPVYKAKLRAVAADPAYSTKISNATKQALADPAIRAKMSAITTARMQDQAVRTATSVALQQALADPTVRARMSHTSQVALADPATQAKMSMISQARWQNITYRNDHALTTAEFIQRAAQVHGIKYDYSKSVYINQNSKVLVSCAQHGDFLTTAQCHLHGSGCPACAISSGQNDILRLIQSCIPQESVIINDRQMIAPYELDIYLPARSLAFEFNGNYRHSYDVQETKEQRERHMQKAVLAESKGIKLIQLAEYDWIYKRDLIKSMIEHKLQLSRKIFARMLQVRPVTNRSEYDQLMVTAHLQGPKYAQVVMGLYDVTGLVSAMSFTPHDDYWEIERYATVPGLAIVGGASKLLMAFRRLYNPTEIRTYADRALSDAGVYLKLGFIHMGYTGPGYVYLDRARRPVSRMACQKYKLPKLLGPAFDPNLTEAENMFRAGYRRMWNAGNHKLIWTRPAK